MALPKPLHKDHEILGDENYCPGYVDAYGSWNNGFPCPVLSSHDPPVFCCGTATHKYCCTGRDSITSATATTTHNASSSDAAMTSVWLGRLPLLMGVLVGAVVALMIVVVVSCLHCSCCLLYKKRQPSSTGPIYQLQGGTSTVSGVANMYSFSRNTTPPHCSVSRSSSVRSASSSDSNRHSLVSLRVPQMMEPSYVSAATMPRYSHMHHNVARSDCGSLISSLASSATPSDSTHRTQTLLLPTSPHDMPPPYTPTSPNSTLVAMRTSVSSSSAPQSTGRSSSSSSRGTHTAPQTREEVFVVGDNGQSSGIFSTFAHSGTAAPPAPFTHTLRTNNNNTLPFASRSDEANDPNPFLLINNHRNYLNSHRTSAFYSTNDNLDNNLNVNTNPQFYNIANGTDNSANGSYNSANVFRSMHHSVSTHEEERGSASPATDEGASSSSGVAKDLSLPMLPSTPKNLHYLHDADGEAYKGSVCVGAPQRTFLLGHTSGYGSPVAIGAPPFSPALTPTTRPCSTAHIVHTDDPASKLFTATKF